MEPEYKIKKSVIHDYKQEKKEKKLNKPSTDKTAKVGKTGFSEKQPMLPENKKLQRRKSGFINRLINKEEKVKVELSPREECIKSLEGIIKAIKHLETFTNENLGEKAIEDMISFLEDPEKNFNEDLKNIIDELSKNYFKHSTEKKIELATKFYNCWIPNQG